MGSRAERSEEEKPEQQQETGSDGEEECWDEVVVKGPELERIMENLVLAVAE